MKKLTKPTLLILNLKSKPNRNRFKLTGFGSVRFDFCCSKTDKTEKQISFLLFRNLFQFTWPRHIWKENRSAHKIQANLGFYCSRKQICPMPTKYKQILVFVVQKNIFAHKLQANYNIIKKKAKTHKMQGWTWSGVRILIIKKPSLFLSTQCPQTWSGEDKMQGWTWRDER